MCIFLDTSLVICDVVNVRVDVVNVIDVVNVRGDVAAADAPEGGGGI